MNRYKTLKDHVYEYIVKQILEGKLLPADRVNETEISQELSVSRTPVREALIQLSCEGVLDNLPRKGFILREVTEKEAQELYAVIGTLDGMAAKIATPLLTEKDLSKMDFYIQSMDLAINTQNYEMYLDQQNAFHQVYIDKCENDILDQTIMQLKSKFFARGLSRNTAYQNDDFLHSINEDHRKILELFRSKDAAVVSDYLVRVHWAPTVAHNELIRK